MFSTEKRCIYRNNQLGEVICQLRFPEILSIQATLPAQFQDAIRDAFPRYMMRKEKAAPKLSGEPGNMRFQQQEQINNYQFSSEDCVWRVNLTSSFISLATSRYECWEDFAARLDQPLAAFIQIYKPACFDRIGLRYLNFISRSKLGLEGVPFRDMIEPAYLGLLQEDDVFEGNVTRSGVDAELAVRDGCRLKLHAGPGKVTIGGNSDPEVKFILDLDLYTANKTPVSHVAGALQALHGQAYSVFRGAITDTLHDAMV